MSFSGLGFKEGGKSGTFVAFEWLNQENLLEICCNSLILDNFPRKGSECRAITCWVVSSERMSRVRNLSRKPHKMSFTITATYICLWRDLCRKETHVWFTLKVSQASCLATDVIRVHNGMVHTQVQIALHGLPSWDITPNAPWPKSAG